MLTAYVLLLFPFLAGLWSRAGSGAWGTLLAAGMGLCALGLAWGRRCQPPSSPRFPVWPHKMVCEFLLGVFLVKLLGLKDSPIYYGCLPVGF